MTREFKDAVIKLYLELRKNPKPVTLQKKDTIDLFFEANKLRYEHQYRLPLYLTSNQDVQDILVELSQMNWIEFSDFWKETEAIYEAKQDIIRNKRIEASIAADLRKIAAGKEILSTLKVGDIIVVKCAGIKYRKVLQINDEYVTGWVLTRVGSVGHVFRQDPYVATNNCKFITKVLTDAIISNK